MIQEVRQEMLLKNGLILYTGDIINIRYKSEEVNEEKNCKGRIKYVCEQFVILDTSSRYNSSEKTICTYEIINMEKADDENEKNN